VLLLLGGGIALRSLVQPWLALQAEATPGAALGRAAMSVAALAELAGALLGVGLLLATARRGPPLTARPGLVAVLPLIAFAFASLLLALALNAAAVVLGGGSALVDGRADLLVTHLGLMGFLVPISLGVSARMFPLYLQVRVPPARGLHALVLVLLLAIALRLAGIALAQPLLEGVGTALEGAALLTSLALLDVPWRRSRPERLALVRPPPGSAVQPRPMPPETGASDALALGAYGALGLAGLLQLATAAAILLAWPTLPPIDAERHALGAGFVTLLIFGMAPRLLPGFAGRRLARPRALWGLVPLAYALALLRIAGPLLPRLLGPASPPPQVLGSAAGILAILALTYFVAYLGRVLAPGR